MRRALVLSVTAAALLTMSGCGFLLVNGPPENHRDLNYFSCTESEVGPVLDWVWAGLNTAGAIEAAANPGDYYNEERIIAVGATWTVVSGAAAIVGQNKVGECREAKRALAQRQAGSDTARDGR